MLGFILSKMQMLIFATGMFLVAAMFLNFMSGVQLRNITSSTLDLQIQTIDGQLSVDSLCSFKTRTIPEYFDFGQGGGTRLYYDLIFSKVEMGNGIQKLVLGISEHGKDKLIDARSSLIKGNIVLIDPGFIASDDPIGNYYVKDSGDTPNEMRMYPRQSTGKNAFAPPNAFIALKQIKDGKMNFFIIPCTTLAKSFSDTNGTLYYLNNCEENILKVGCEELFNSSANPPAPSDLIDQCFEVDREIIETDYYTSKVSELSWKDCLNHGYHKGS